MLPAFGAMAEPGALAEGAPVEEAAEEVDDTAVSVITFQGSPAELPSDVPGESEQTTTVTRRARFGAHREAAKAGVVPPFVSVQVAPAPAEDAPIARAPPGRRASFGADDIDEDALRQVMEATLASDAPVAGDVTPPDAAASAASDAHVSVEPAAESTPPPVRRRGSARDRWPDTDVDDEDVSELLAPPSPPSTAPPAAA